MEMLRASGDASDPRLLHLRAQAVRMPRACRAPSVRIPSRPAHAHLWRSCTACTALIRAQTPTLRCCETATCVRPRAAAALRPVLMCGAQDDSSELRANACAALLGAGRLEEAVQAATAAVVQSRRCSAPPLPRRADCSPAARYGQLRAGLQRRHCHAGSGTVQRRERAAAAGGGCVQGAARALRRRRRCC